MSKFTKKEEHLIKKDIKLKNIIEDNGHIPFRPNKQNQFNSLVGIVISQFISTTAANSIFEKVKINFNTAYLDPSYFKDYAISDIKRLGLTRNKAMAIKALSDMYLKDDFINLTDLNNKDLNNNLLSVFGIGPWSINMFEIFCIGKLDIFTSKDAGLRMAMNKFGFVKPGSGHDEYYRYSQTWSPYRTIASLHLWKSVD